MIDRPGFDAKRQRETLKGLQLASGREATEIARDVGLSYPQYNRYLWGHVPLRTDQIRRFAAAYGVAPAKILDGLGLLADTFDARTYLRGRLQESDIDAFIREHGAAKPEAQRVAADGMLEIAAEQRRGDPLPAPMDAPNSSRRDQPAS